MELLKKNKDMHGKDKDNDDQHDRGKHNSNCVISTNRDMGE